MISEAKKKIVIENYFQRDCSINTSIKEAYTRGFERGLQKYPKRPPGHWIDDGERNLLTVWKCSECGFRQVGADFNYCPDCGSPMNGRGKDE